MQHFSLHWLRRPPTRQRASQKKRQRQRRRWNTVSGRTNPFSKNTLPCLQSSGFPSHVVRCVQVVYCPLILLSALLSLQPRRIGSLAACLDSCPDPVRLPCSDPGTARAFESLLRLFPAQCTAGLVFDDTRLKKVSLFFQIDH